MKKVLGISGVLALALSASGCMTTGTTTDGSSTMSVGTIMMYVGIIVVFFVAMYFIAIRPEKKREKEQQNLLSTLTKGDTVLTNSGFYGTCIDVTEDTVIVEFGNNKNCRIPMQKAAIVQLEHPEGYVPPTPAVTETATEEKKGFFKNILKKKEQEK